MLRRVSAGECRRTSAVNNRLGLGVGQEPDEVQKIQVLVKRSRFSESVQVWLLCGYVFLTTRVHEFDTWGRKGLAHGEYLKLQNHVDTTLNTKFALQVGEGCCCSANGITEVDTESAQESGKTSSPEAEHPLMIVTAHTRCLPDGEKGSDAQRMAVQKEIICDGSAMVLKQKGRGISDGICRSCRVPKSGTTRN